MNNLSTQEIQVLNILHSITSRFQPSYEIVSARLNISFEKAKEIMHNILLKENK